MPFDFLKRGEQDAVTGSESQTLQSCNASENIIESELDGKGCSEEKFSDSNDLLEKLSPHERRKRLTCNHGTIPFYR